MQLKEVTDRQSYNQFVATTEGGSFLQSWEWGEWQKALGRQVIRCLVIDESGKQIAAIQLVKMPLSFGKHYAYAPYGPVVSGQLTRESIVQLLQLLTKRFPKALFIRIEPQVLQLPTDYSSIVKSQNIQPAISAVLNITATQEQLLSSMHSKTRYNIKLAERHNVEVQDEFVVTPGNGLYSKEAIDLIVQTQKRQNYRGHSESYYKKMVDFFALNNRENDLKLHIYKALYQKKILASGIFIDFGKTRMYLYGGSSDQYRNVMAPYALHWRAICDAQKIGLTNYDFGGSEVSGGGERGFTRFKQGFSAQVVNYAGAYDLILNPFLYKTYGLLRKVNRMLLKISG